MSSFWGKNFQSQTGLHSESGKIDILKRSLGKFKQHSFDFGARKAEGNISGLCHLSCGFFAK